jgi:hypothetical protein
VPLTSYGNILSTMLQYTLVLAGGAAALGRDDSDEVDLEIDSIDCDSVTNIN